jgi:cytochrome c oxidase subunit 2
VNEAPGRLHRWWPALAALLVLGACRFGAPPGATEEGRDIAALYRLFGLVALGVGVITYGLILWAVFRYRRRSDALPEQTRYHVPTEVAYTVIPVLIVLALFAFTYRTDRRVTSLDSRPSVVLDVEAFQWQWRFTYRELGVEVVGGPDRPPTVVLPVGEPVRVNLRAVDVIHAFYVPEFLFKRDAIPGLVNRFEFTIPRPGRFRGACAEFCGLDHDEMVFFIEAVPRGDFDRWVAERGGGGG